MRGVVILVCLIVTVIVIRVGLKLMAMRRLMKQKAVLLELTPPANVEKSAEATQRLFSIIHGLNDSRTWRDKLFMRHPLFSLEIVSTREQGIRYVVRTNEDHAPTLEHTVAAYLPDVKFRRTEDHLHVAGTRVLVFRQSKHFAYPLQTQDVLQEHDPMGYLAGAMTKLASGEQITFQIVLSPTKVREADAISKRLLHNEELLSRLGRRQMRGIGWLFNGINDILFGILDAVGDIGAPAKTTRTVQTQSQHKQQVDAKIKPARTLSVFEQELAMSVHNKLRQPLFKTDIRIMVQAKNKHEEQLRIKNIRAALASFSVPKYQSLKMQRNFPAKIKQPLRAFLMSHRLPAFFGGSSLLSASEIASLYHFPHLQTTKTENVAKSLSKTLAAPISLKTKTNFDIVLGRNHHHRTKTDIGLTAQERERHIYIIGGTGNGKTTLMLYSMVQSLKRKEGFAFIDPHGDAAQTVLRHIPEDRVNDVIYFNPDDLANPIGLNLLELTPGLSGDELLREKDIVTESAISVFRKIFSEDDSGGHRIEYVLRNAIQTALTTEEPTIFTIFRLLNDAKYRKKIVAELEDEDLKSFWKNELGKAGEFQRVKMSAGITAKVGRFLFSASAKRILEQPRSTIDFDDLLNSGKILICNFSKGLLGEDTSELFGITVLAKLQLAALRRARIEQASRRPFYLYVDEFQNFATMSFVQMLSEARKYKLFLTMAEQSTSQQDDQQMVNTILANVGTVICFRTGNPADERLLLPLFAPYIEEGDIANLPAYNFYARLAAVRSQEPVSGQTLLLDDEGSGDIAAKVRIASQKNYAIRYKERPEATATVKETKPQQRASKPKTTRRRLPDA